MAISMESPGCIKVAYICSNTIITKRFTRGENSRGALQRNKGSSDSPSRQRDLTLVEVTVFIIIRAFPMAQQVKSPL